MDVPPRPPATTVGVIIRTLNEAELIGQCLEMLRRQRSPYEPDILVVDSGSTDSTVEIAESQGARILHIPAGDFDYSRALNAGFEEVGGELVISLSAHAIPLDESWLARMAAPFEDPRVAGVTCRQVPWPDAPWHEAQRLARTFGETGRRHTQVDDGLVFSNAASCIRRSVWREQSFMLPAAEDRDWAHRVVAAGWVIVYEPAAAVYHSHDESPRAQARRLIDINRVLAGEGSPRTPLRTLREAAGLLYRDGTAILALDRPPRRKLADLGHLIRMVSYYVSDFGAAGTTAERRRQDGSRPA